jgi:hypothetical protein
MNVPLPPKRLLHVVNASPPSLPPAYNLSEEVNVPLDSKPTHKSTNPSPRHATPRASADESSAGSVHSSTSTRSKVSNKKLTGLPPQLSLRDSSCDISSWSQALLSVLPSPSDIPPNPPPEDAAASAPHKSSSLQRSASTKSNKSARTNKPLPVIVLPGDEDEDGSTSPSARTPLWDEILGMVQEASPSSFSPALNETLSPTLPSSPTESEQRFNIDSYMTVSGTSDHGGDETLLSVEDREYPSNRDSGTSTISTATVTAATIVNNVSVAKRATANFFHTLQIKEDDGLGDGKALSLSVASSVDLDSPMSSNFSSSSGSGSGSSSFPSQEQEQHLDMNVPSPRSPVYLDVLDSPLKSEFNSGGLSPVLSESGTFGLAERAEAEKKQQQQATLVNGIVTACGYTVSSSFLTVRASDSRHSIAEI